MGSEMCIRDREYTVHPNDIMMMFKANEPVNEPVNERQQTILSIMKQNPSIIREDLANKLGISLATLKRELTSLRKEGYITRNGSDKNGQWIVVSK